MHLVRLASVAATLLLLAACSSTSEDALSGTAGSGGPGAAGGNLNMSDTTNPGGMGSSELGAANGAGAAGPASPGTQQDLEVNVGDRVFFGYDSSVLDDAARQTVERQAAWMQQFTGVTSTIEGHTDERGTTEYNLALGERRAEAVKSYLTALGIDPARLLTISYGEERPVEPGHDEAAYKLNRRAVTVVNVTQ